MPAATWTPSTTEPGEGQREDSASPLGQALNEALVTQLHKVECPPLGGLLSRGSGVWTHSVWELQSFFTSPLWASVSSL